MNVGLAALVALILITAAPFIAETFSEPRFAPVLRAVAPLLIIYSLSGVLQSKLRRDLKLKGFAYASIIATILGAIVAAIMAVMGFEVWSLVCQQWVYAITSTAMFLFHAGWLPKTAVVWSHIQRLAGFSFNVIGAALLRFALRQLDLIFIGAHLPSKQVGLYFLATRTLNTVGQLTYYSIQRLGLPVLARLQDDPVRQRAAIVSTLKLTCLVCLPVFWGMATIADLVIPLAFGWEWNGTVEPFRILSGFCIFYALSLIANQILLSAGFASIVFRLSAFNAALFAAAVAAAAPHGIAMTAIAGGIANTICLPVYFFMLRRKLGIGLARLGADLLPIWTSALAMVAAVVAARVYLLTSLDPLLTLILAVLIGTAAFMCALWLLRRDYVDEITALVFGGQPGRS
jgi:PST family polysaccharide transporter